MGSRQVEPEPIRCRECGRTGNDWYWTDLTGQKMERPRCGECHEEAVRQWTRHAVHDAADLLNLHRRFQAA